MSLKSAFATMKKEGYVTKPLDQYLLGLNDTDADRAININAPSSAGGCLRARYYSRVGAERDGSTIDARTRRIFDNGTHFHLRTQEYLLKAGVLVMDEIPVHNSDHEIQGHTDGLIKVTARELAVLELKSINSKGFSELKEAKPEHRRQGLIYLFCLEEHRVYLREKYKTAESFKKSAMKRRATYTKLYSHLKDGNKYTREEKLKFQVGLHMKLDKILWETEEPITKAVFVYENKDTQDMKEYVVSTNEASAKNILRDELKACKTVNECVRTHDVPEREGQGRSDYVCRWCAYKNTCWVV